MINYKVTESIRSRPGILVCSILLLTAFSSKTNAQNNDNDVVIHMDSTAQEIRGFGAANIVGWRPDMTEEDIENSFGTEDGQLGMTILRLRIPPNENQWSNNLPSAQKAHEMGITIIASPWSPPAHMKTNSDLVGGRLQEDSYGEYAAHLNHFVEYMEENGVSIHAVSLQNEPDIEVGYESCDWSSEEMITFLQEHRDSIKTRVIAPESFQFRRQLSDPILNDSLANANFEILGGHIYGGGLGPYPLAEEKGKEIWMTEYLMNHGATGDWELLSEESIWEESMEMLTTVQRSMNSNWNAYIWWYLKRYYSFIGDGEQRTANGKILKRGYAFSQFSKFVRPGYTRIYSNGPFGRGFNRVSATAYKDSTTIVIVAVNDEPEDKEINFITEDGTPVLFSQYQTSLTQDVEQLEDIEVESNSFTTTLPAKSVTTYVSEYVPVSNEEVTSIPTDIELQQNYPNPFNPSTEIHYKLPASSHVQLKVFDMLGRQVATLMDGRVSAGEHRVHFDASNLSSGIYLYRLKAGNVVQTRKMMLIK